MKKETMKLRIPVLSLLFLFVFSLTASKKDKVEAKGMAIKASRKRYSPQRPKVLRANALDTSANDLCATQNPVKSPSLFLLLQPLCPPNGQFHSCLTLFSP
jgi:hypothetical protein